MPGTAATPWTAPTPRCGPRASSSTATCGRASGSRRRGATGRCRLSLHGVQQVHNALAAAAAALWCGVPFDRRGVGPVVRHRAPRCAWRCTTSRRPRPDRGLLQRQPGVDRGGTAFAGRAAGATGRRLALLGLMAELGKRDGGRAPAHRVRSPRSSGSRSWATRPTSTGDARLPAPTRPSRCCGPPGRRTLLLVKGSRVARLEDVVRAYGSAAGAQSLVAGA